MWGYQVYIYQVYYTTPWYATQKKLLFRSGLKFLREMGRVLHNFQHCRGFPVTRRWGVQEQHDRLIAGCRLINCKP